VASAGRLCIWVPLHATIDDVTISEHRNTRETVRLVMVLSLT